MKRRNAIAALTLIVCTLFSNNGTAQIQQAWVARYNNGITDGTNQAVKMVLDSGGNIYVTGFSQNANSNLGYDTTTAGGTEMVLIKYSPALTLQLLTGGTVLLQTQGETGESFDIQASADLLNWLDLGSVLADTNGLMQFDDTNAPNYPARFYTTKPQ